MRYLLLAVTIAGFVHALLAAIKGDANYAFGLLGGSFAWAILTKNAFDAAA